MSAFTHTKMLLTAGLTTLLLTSCSLYNKGASETEATVEEIAAENNRSSKRIPILLRRNHVEIDASLADIDIVLPSADTLGYWRQMGASASHSLEHLSSTLENNISLSANVGKGKGWAGQFIPAPIASADHIFAIDAKGAITAHATANITDIAWTNQSLAHDDSGLAGGGLALTKSTIVAVNAHGMIAGINSDTGEELWTRNLRTPVRSAPAISQGMVIISTAGSETIALDNRNGRIIWKHRGIQEVTNILSYATPAILGNIVIAAYPSGEIFAIHRLTGKALWADSLLVPRRTSALGNFTGVTGNPVIARNVVFAASSNGLMAANSLNNGLRLWEHELSSYNTPWIAGRFMFAISSDHKLIAIHASDGRIKWIHDLNNSDANAGRFMGPYIINNDIAVISDSGRWMTFDPKTGDFISDERRLKGNAFSQPIILESGVAYVDNDAKLHLMK